MFNLSAIQDALRQLHFDGWLLYDFRGLNVLARRIVAVAGRPDAVAALVLFRPGPRASRASSSTASSRTRSTICRDRADLSALAGTGSRRRPTWSPARKTRGHGIRAAQRQSVCLARRCRHRSNWCGRSASTIVPSGDLVQLFEALGTTSNGRCTWKRPSTRARPYDVAWEFIAERVESQRLGARTEVQRPHPRALRGARPGHRSSADRRRRPAQRRSALRAAARRRDGAIREGRFRAHRPVGQARQAAGRLQRPDVDRVRRRRRCPSKYAKIFQIVAAGRDAAIAARQGRLRRRASRCRAGRSIEPRAT